MSLNYVKILKVLYNLVDRLCGLLTIYHHQNINKILHTRFGHIIVLVNLYKKFEQLFPWFMLGVFLVRTSQLKQQNIGFCSFLCPKLTTVLAGWQKRMHHNCPQF